ncbi:uncharacterized protein LOC114471508 [Gouania willdenowi]|uniref:uncharacterized protein LOC114471508 n=1 Tax=Gouania willdenowi TaxID=441366 RepID=UPI001054AFFF|nr:uncharacterized protein LOC114471508 [Gouania willdenowi]
MGNAQRKALMENNDVKFMQRKYPGSCCYLDDWYKNCGFAGKLSDEAGIEKVSIWCKGKRVKALKKLRPKQAELIADHLRVVCIWKDAMSIRKTQIEKGEERRKQKVLAAAAKIQPCDETVCVPRRVEETNQQQNGAAGGLQEGGAVAGQETKGPVTRATYTKPPSHEEISACRQKSDETPMEYRARLETVFRTNSGLPHSPLVDNPYQIQLKMWLISGLLPNVSDFIKANCVTHRTLTVPELMEWAEHAYEVTEKKKAKTESANVNVLAEAMAAALVSQRSGFKRQGKKPYRTRTPDEEKQAKIDREKRQCFICHEEGHMARDCPKRKQKTDHTSFGQTPRQ